MKRAALILLMLLVSITPALAQSTKKQENRRAQLKKEIAIINDQLKENAKGSSRALSDLNLTRKKIGLRKDLIAENEREIRMLNDSIRFKENEIGRLQRRLDTLNVYYNRLIRSAYRNRDTRLWYLYILSGKNIAQSFRRFAYLRSFSTEISRQANDIRETADRLEIEKEQLEGLKADARKSQIKLQEDMASLKEEEGKSEEIIARLKKDEKKYRAELDKKNKQVEALNREIAEIIRKANKGSSGGKGSGGKKTSTEVDTKLASEFASNRGKLPWPVEGSVTETYGQHYHPTYKNIKLPFSNGVTITTSKSAPVKAVFNGKVVQVVVLSGYNQCIILQHGNYFTFYCRVRGITVKAGDKVTTGQVIGYVDTVGDETSLHFQLWKDSASEDPELWLK